MELVAEVEDVICLLVAKSAVLVLGQNLDRVLLLHLLDLALSLRVGERLRDRIVLDLLALDELAGDLAVGLGLALEILLGLIVVGDASLPLIIAVLEAHCPVRVSEEVTIRRHFKFSNINNRRELVKFQK